jgi:hypothetical protein
MIKTQGGYKQLQINKTKLNMQRQIVDIEHMFSL